MNNDVQNAPPQPSNKAEDKQDAPQLRNEPHLLGAVIATTVRIQMYAQKEIEKLLTDERNKVLEEVDRLQKECAESDGLIDGVTVLHKLRTKLAQLKGTDAKRK